MTKAFLLSVTSLLIAPSVATAQEAQPKPNFVSKVLNTKFFKRLVDQGTASWYGPGFQGNPTSSGRRFDMYKPMCAHRTLPFGTVIRIVNDDTGASAICTVWDRGPFARGRVLDMSFAVKKAIIGSGGTGQVSIYIR